MRKTRGAALLAAALAGTMLFSGCNTVGLIGELAGRAQDAPDSSDAQNAEIVEDGSGRYAMTITDGWEEALSGDLSGDAALELANKNKDCYVILLAEAKEDFSGDFVLDDYTEVVLENLKDSMADAQIGQRDALSVDGMHGTAVTMTGKIEVEILEGKTRKMDAVYWIDFLENEEDFVRVVGWTSGERADANRQPVQEVMRSLKR